MGEPTFTVGQHFPVGVLLIPQGPWDLGHEIKVLEADQFVNTGLKSKFQSCRTAKMPLIY